MGTAIAKIDKGERIRIPSDLLKTCEEEFGNEVFITSTDDRTVQIYPLAVWRGRVDSLTKEKKADPLLRRFLLKANYNGQIVKIDGRGRIQIPGFLKKKIRLAGKITFTRREGRLELMRL